MTIGSGITSIGNYAFSNNSALQSVTISATTPPNLAADAFYNTNCTIYVPCESVAAYQMATNWSAYASRITCIFDGELLLAQSDGTTIMTECTSSSSRIYSSNTSDYSSTTISAIIGDCVLSANTQVFWNFTNMTDVRFGNSMTYIGDNAFLGCSSLKSIDLPNSLVTIGKNAFNGCSHASSVTIPNGVTTIKDYAFQNCRSLTSVSIPNSVTTMSAYTFYGCSGLTGVTIGSGLTYIPYGAFQNCNGLRNVTIPSGVTSIHDYAFAYCSGLTSITVEATTPPNIGQYSLQNTNNCRIYVPAASVDTYKAANGWSQYASRIQAIP